jgi:hypothetical protein
MLGFPYDECGTKLYTAKTNFYLPPADISSLEVIVMARPNPILEPTILKFTAGTSHNPTYSFGLLHQITTVL